MRHIYNPKGAIFMLRTAWLFSVSLYFALVPYAFAQDSKPDPRVKGAEQYHLTEGAETSAELVAAISQADSEMFDAVFAHCDPVKAGTMVTDDVRFIHDKAGQIASSKSELMRVFGEGCANQAKGTDFRSRRELVPGSLHVYAINQYGAVELGQHRFFALIPGKAEQLTEIGDFVILWKLVDKRWLMSEAISYNHRLTQ
jgi:uncharacterized protein DUF4440